MAAICLGLNELTENYWCHVASGILVNISLDNGLAPGQCKATTETNTDLQVIRHILQWN